MTTFTLPTPVFEKPGRDYDGKPSRSRKVNYPLGPPTTTDKGKVEQRIVQVYVGHSKGSKQFYANANIVTREVDPTSPFAVESSFPFDAVTLMRQPVARYSAKALDEFAAKVVHLFEPAVVVTPKLLAMFEGEPA